MNESFYDILNISKNASEEEIKKSYRKLAIKYHPDKAPADKKDEHSEKFKKISEAYGILSDSEKRNIYDRFGKEAALDNDQGHSSGPGVNPHDIFNQFFGQGGGPMGGGFFEMNGEMPPGFGGGHFPHMRRQENKSSPIKHVIEITLEEGYQGMEKEILYTIMNNDKEEEKKITIEIPKGCGQSIKMMKKGVGNIKKNMEQGDLIIIIQVKEHDLFKVQQNNLILEKKIKFGTSLLGAYFSINHINGDTININTKGQIFNEEIRVISGLGLHHIQNQELGDLIIKFEVEKCKEFDESEQKKLRELFEFDENHENNENIESYEAITVEELHEQMNDDSDEGQMPQGEQVQCAQS
jgi:DnaJ-class molecular chaperone